MSKSSFLFTLIFSFLFTTSAHAADFAFYKKTTNYNIETSIGIATGDTRAAFAVKIVNKENTSLTNTLKVYKTVGTTTTCSSDIVFTETHTAQPQATFEKNIPISTLTPNTTYCFDYSEWVGEHFTTDKGTELPGGTSPAVSDGSYHLLAPFPGLSVLIDQSQCGSAKPGEICSIGDLLNFIFKILIGVTAVILVFRLVYEGYTYMVTDVPFLKASSKGNFMTALGGLLLAMAAWLILNTINPKLVSNDISVEEVSVGVENPEGIGAFDFESIKNLSKGGKISCPAGGGQSSIPSIAQSFVGKVSYNQDRRNSVISDDIYLDCSSYVATVLDCAGFDTNRSSTTVTFFSGAERINPSTTDYSKNIVNGIALQPGDLIGWPATSKSGHVLIYIGNGTLAEVHGPTYPTKGGKKNAAASTTSLASYSHRDQFTNVKRLSK